MCSKLIFVVINRLGVSNRCPPIVRKMPVSIMVLITKTTTMNFVSYTSCYTMNWQKGLLRRTPPPQFFFSPRSVFLVVPNEVLRRMCEHFACCRPESANHEKLLVYRHIAENGGSKNVMVQLLEDCSGMDENTRKEAEKHHIESLGTYLDPFSLNESEGISHISLKWFKFFLTQLQYRRLV